MSFKPNIPQSADKPSLSQRDLLNNFTSLDTAIANNHIALTAASSEAGKHTFLQLPERDGTASAPYLATAVNEVGLLSRNSGTVPDLLFVPENTLAVNVPTAGLRLTGGGLTAAAYCTFTGATPPVLATGSFNISGVVRNFAGNWTVSFSRNFADTNYVVIVSSFSQGEALSALTKNVNNVTFQTNTVVVSVHIVIFGLLA